MTDRSPLQQHRWLIYSWTEDVYFPSAYCDRLLKSYTGVREEVEFFAEYLLTCLLPVECLNSTAARTGQRHTANAPFRASHAHVSIRRWSISVQASSGRYMSLG